AHIDRRFGQPINRSHVCLSGFPKAGFSEIEDWYLELRVAAATSSVSAATFALRPRDAGNFQQVDEPRRLCQSVGLSKSIGLNACNLQIDAPPNRFDFDRSHTPRVLG